MRAGLDLIFTAAQGASERMRRVAVIVKHQVGVTVAVEPAGKFFVLLGERGADGGFGAGAVVPGGGRGDVLFVVEAFAELVVGAAYVLAQGVAAGRFVLGEIARGGAGVRCSGARAGRKRHRRGVALSRRLGAGRDDDYHRDEEKSGDCSSAGWLVSAHATPEYTSGAKKASLRGRPGVPSFWEKRFHYT